MTDELIESVVENIAGGKKNIVLDATMLTSLMTCARFADLRFNHSLVSLNGKSNSLECGSIVHKFLEVYYGSMIHGMDKEKAFQHGMAAAEMYIRGCPHCTNFEPTVPPARPGGYTIDEAEALGYFSRPKCGHPPNEYPGVQNTPIETEGYKTGWKWVLTTCEQYHVHYKSDYWVPLEVEVVKGKILYEDDEIRILWKAKLDLTSDTNQGIYPIDHKTMKQRRETLSLNNQFIGQCIIMGTRNVIINKIGFQATLKPAEKFVRAPISYSAARLMEWQSEILPYYAKLLLMYSESGHFPPNYSACEGKFGPCIFTKVCEADPMMREEELKINFKVGPEWNPTNVVSEE